MKKFWSLALICVVCILITTAATADELMSGFRNPPDAAKARTWWHWINGNVTKEGITADLEAMKRVGIQEAQIFNVDQGYPEGPTDFFTPEWLDCFNFAVMEAKRLGLEIGFNNCAGWSSSGGPWITPQYAMQTIVSSEVQLNGGSAIQKKLSQPPTKLNYYKDIVILAFPTPKDGTRLDKRDVKTLSNDSFTNHLEPDAKQIPRAAVVRRSDIVDLTSKMSADGTLNWDAPAGNWTVLRIGHTPTGSENRPANLSGRGLECDKMSRAAVDMHWAAGVEPILEKVGPLVGSYLTNCLVDSYEVGCGNWTEGFDKEFARRCAYDCIEFLPTIAGYYVESGEMTERFLWDFRRTIADMMADNHYDYFRELCHKRGMKFSSEPYGGPFDCMAVGESVDIPMSEFWVGHTVFQGMSKMAASMAHLNGTAEVGAESFSSVGTKWLSHPSTMKPLGDWAWSEGVNRFLFHTYAHQPWNVAPGVSFHMYGTESRLNTWWEQSKAYMDYIARSQFLLQQGRFAADVLVFVGESAPNDGVYRRDIKALGYDYDEIATNKIYSLTVQDGLIRTPVGGMYRVLVLPKSQWMTPGLLKKLRSLAEKGAVIIGSKPMKSPSLRGFPKSDAELKKLADELWGAQTASTAKALIRDVSVNDALNEVGLAPDFNGGATGSDLLFIHRIVDDTDVYFVANQQKKNRTEVCKFRIVGKQPQRWNPQTGEIAEIAEWQSDGDGTKIPMSFDPEESCFIVFKEPTSKTANHIVKTQTKMAPVEIYAIPNLKIIKAEYGYFIPDGMVDVTAILSLRIKNGRLDAASGNSLADDPAPGVSKELRVIYSVDGKEYRIKVPEHRTETIPLAGQSGEFKLIKALYGKFAPDFDDTFVYSHLDITQQINTMIASKELVFPVDDRLTGGSVPDRATGKKLHLVYSVDGEITDVMLPEGREVDMTLYRPEPKIIVEEDKIIWITPQPGEIVYSTASGVTKTAEVKTVAETIEVSGAWSVSFPPKQGAPAEATFDTLCSWPLSNIDGIRHFSGTATYRKQITVPQEYIQTGRSLELDLGQVRVIAEVIVNGENLGILWKAPFRIDLGNAVKAGQNDIEIRVTNLWPNRLIGDARYPEDCEWGDSLPKSWPDWLVNNTQRPSERTTFTTWKHWGANDPLQPSGLLGPVVLRPYVHVVLLE